MNDSKTQTKSTQSTSVDTESVDTVFHQSRVINEDEKITIRPVEIVATYDVQESSTNNAHWCLRDPEFAHNNGSHIIDEDNIPLISIIDKRGGVDDVPKAVSTRHYVRCESKELLNDVYIEFGIGDDDKKVARTQLNDLEQLIGEQNIDDDDLTFDVHPEKFDAEVQADINTNEITVYEDKRDTLVDTDADRITQYFQRLALDDTNKFEKLGRVFSVPFTIGIGFGYVVLLLLLLVTQTVSMIHSIMSIVGLFIYLAESITAHLYREVKDDVETFSPFSPVGDFSYQTDRPDDAHTISDVGSDSADSIEEQVTVTADIDKEHNVCHFRSIDDERVWDVDLENGLMTPEIVTFFEQIGSEKVDEEFVVWITATNSDHSIETNTTNTYLSPPEI